MNDREALVIALDALMNGGHGNEDITEKAIKIVKDQLEKPERKWVELTEEDWSDFMKSDWGDVRNGGHGKMRLAWAFAQQRLKEKNADQ